MRVGGVGGGRVVPESLVSAPDGIGGGSSSSGSSVGNVSIGVGGNNVDVGCSGCVGSGIGAAVGGGVGDCAVCGDC